VTQHSQAPVPGTDFEADAGIANLLALYAAEDLPTVFSCQGSPQWHGYLHFASLGDLPRFVEFTEDLLLESGERDLLLALRRLSERDEQISDTWRIETTFNPYLAGLEAVRRENVLGRPLADIELDVAARTGWAFILRAPSADLAVLDELAVARLRHG
jgi:hypothetical protein